MHKDFELTDELLKNSLKDAEEVLKIEAEAVLGLKKSIDEKFEKAVQLILESEGRVVFTGMGKSGLIAQKLAATFSSTGTPAFFVHAGEAMHGDIGMVTFDDVVIAISHSGETEEVVGLLPAIRRIGSKMISLTGDTNSTLAEYSDICLYTDIEEEAWKQIGGVLSVPYLEKLVILPDVHMGYTFPIGTVASINDYICPAGVGFDIGCLSGSTKIPLLDGNDYSLKYLYEKNIKNFFVFCVDNKRNYRINLN